MIETLVICAAILLAVAAIPAWWYCGHQILKLNRLTKIQKAWNDKNRHRRAPGNKSGRRIGG